VSFVLPAIEVKRAVASLGSVFSPREMPTIVFDFDIKSLTLRQYASANPIQTSTTIRGSFDRCLSFALPFAQFLRYAQLLADGSTEIVPHGSGVDFRTTTGSVKFATLVGGMRQPVGIGPLNSFEVRPHVVARLVRLCKIASRFSSAYPQLSGVLIAGDSAYATDGDMWFSSPLDVSAQLGLAPSVLPHELSGWSAGARRSSWKVEVDGSRFRVTRGSCSCAGSMLIDRFPRPLPRPIGLASSEAVLRLEELRTALDRLRCIEQPERPVAFYAGEDAYCLSVGGVAKLATEWISAFGGKSTFHVPLGLVQRAAAELQGDSVRVARDPVRSAVWLITDEMWVLLPEIR
jgi:hypothetical protein